jgi:hypothetical protein
MFSAVVITNFFDLAEAKASLGFDVMNMMKVDRTISIVIPAISKIS